ncbi:MAG: bifunctional diaminohydroxyphosphoribosylaminopyrimidine deaminase/5-amino-6-(5-phosphoribosylamino)uracil reductase RibD [Verrucomicrobiota bacterium]
MRLPPLKQLDEDQRWMREALELAAKGQGRTSPNPCVGAIIVSNGQCLGKGYHKKAGGPHAEVEAVRAAIGNGFEKWLKGATIYVTLEPCSTYGKTPPCSELILKHGFARVVVGAKDPNPSHAGRAFRIFRNKGLEVKTGVMRQEAEDLNRAFNHWIITGRPWVVAKLAMSLDGKLTRPPRQGQWITGEKARWDVQKERALCDAILVGAETVRKDNPKLTLRNTKGVDLSINRQPWRVIVTKSGRLPKKAHVFTDAFKEKTIIYKNRKWSEALDDLGAKQVTRLMVEGGGKVVNHLAKLNGINEVILYYAPLVFDKKESRGLVHADKLRDLQLSNTQLMRLGDDLKLTGIVKS